MRNTVSMKIRIIWTYKFDWNSLLITARQKK